MKIFNSKALLSLALAICVVSPMGKVNAATQNTITRSAAEQRALSMINLTWTYDSSKNGTLSDDISQKVTIPNQFKNVTSMQATGIPYNWGGQDSLDSTSYSAPWLNFLDAINKGAYAGNVNTSAGYGYITGTAGVDCSGFVQSVFNIKDSKLSTVTLLDNYFTKINLNDIKHMDILDKPHDHVVIFDKWGTLNGRYGAFTYESTPDQTYGGIQGTKKYFISLDEINTGYIAGRYINISEDETNLNTLGQVINVNTAANLRDSNSTAGNIVGTIPKGTIVYLIDYLSGWYKIKYNGNTSWIYGNLINRNLTGKYVTVTNASMLNVRSAPSSSASILGYFTNNQYAEVIGYSSDGKWIKVRVNGLEGYSSSSYLSYIN